MLTIIPEKILLESLRTAFAYLRKDFSLHADESNTLLYKILQGNSIDRYELFKQAKAVFLAPQDNPRHLDIRLYFNSERAPLPTIHITLPSENTINNTLGIGEGLRDNEFITDESDSYRRTFNRRFTAKYNLIVTSDNTNEVVLIYHLTRSILISLIEYFAQRGLDSIKIGGSDLNIKNDLVPVNIHFRAISIEFQYDVGAIDFIKTDVISSLDFNAIMIDTLSDPYYCGEVSQFSVSANPATSSNECCDCTGLSEYLQTNTYQVGVAAIHNKNIYQSTSVTTGPFDSTKWVNLFEDLFNKNNDTTDDILNEGTRNLWYTNTRVDARIELKSGVVGGFAPLDSNLKIPNSYLYSSGGGGTITSVNGDSGPVVVLDTDDINEGSINFYYTDLRADNRIDAQKGVANGIADLDSNSKLSLSYLTLTDSYIYVGNASNIPVGVSLSGDATLSNLGALTLSTVNSNTGSWGSATQVPQFTVNGKGLITAVSNITIAPAASSITGGQALIKVDDTNVTLTLGGTPNTALLQSTSLTLGWTGQLSVSRGGTGLSTFGGTNTLLYTTTANNISSISTSNTSALITNSSGIPSWTSGSTANRVLRTDGTSITFSQVSLTTDISGILPIANGGTNKSSYTSGSVIYYDGTSLTENNSQLFWNNTNNRLGIGTNTSLGAKLHISNNSGTATNKLFRADGSSSNMFYIQENGYTLISTRFGIRNNNTTLNAAITVGNTDNWLSNVGDEGLYMNEEGSLTPTFGLGYMGNNAGYEPTITFYKGRGTWASKSNISSGDDIGSIAFNVRDSSTRRTIIKYGATSLGGADSRFYIKSHNGTALIDVLTILGNNSSVGIGITAPTAKLHLYSNTGTSTNKIFNVDSTVANYLYVEESGDVVFGASKGVYYRRSTGAFTYEPGWYPRWHITNNTPNGNDPILYMDSGILSMVNQSTGTKGFYFDSTNGKFCFSSSGGSSLTGLFTFSLGSTATSSTVDAVLFQASFSPTSGTAVYNVFSVKPTINQTGGANGITRGLYISPTLTSASDWRSIEVETGNSLFGTTSGNVGIGPITSPISTLDVSGSIGAAVRRVATGETMSTSYTTYVLTNSAASDQTFTCPTIASSTNRIYFLKNQSQTYNMTIDGDGSEEFIPLGAVPVTSFDLAPGEACMIQNDGTYWNIF